jgi:ribonucleoside-diphosphate reductase subunit M2
MESLKMGDSPAKKIDFSVDNKENCEVAVPVAGLPELDLPTTDASTNGKPNVASTIKAEEAHEPLLQENPQRFVLFPIKYHEVCGASATATIAVAVASRVS